MDRIGGVVHLVGDLGRRHERQVAVGLRVVNDHVARVGDLTGHAGVGADVI
jgi:hypothetical protein